MWWDGLNRLMPQCNCATVCAFAAFQKEWVVTQKSEALAQRNRTENGSVFFFLFRRFLNRFEVPPRLLESLDSLTQLDTSCTELDPYKKKNLLRTIQKISSSSIEF